MEPNFGYFEEDEFGSLTDAALWQRIAGYARGQWQGLVVAILLSMAVIAAGLALPYLVRVAIDSFIMNPTLAAADRLSGLRQIAWAMVALILAGFGANFLQVTLLEWTGQNIMHRLRLHLFTHMQGMDLEFFNNSPGGKLVTRLTNDIQNMHEMFTSVIVTIFNDLLQVVVILALLFAMNAKLAGLMLLLLPLMAGATYVFSFMARAAFRDIRTQLARLNAFLQESLSGMPLIQLFLHEARVQARFEEQTQGYLGTTLRQIRIFGIFLPLIDVFSSVAVAVIIWQGGSRILEGSMTLGMLTAFIAYMRLFFKPARELAQNYSIVQSALASAERIFETLDRKSALVIRDPPVHPDTVHGRIAFEGVTFGYQAGQPVLHDLNLEIAPGETVAFVGATGSGKSTVVNLLERLYDPDQGTIRLDGADLRHLDPGWLRRQIGLVLQEVLILPDTVRANLLFQRDLDPARLAQVLAQSQLAAVVDRLPQGLDTRIGEGGIDLSAGQKQLLALARVLAHDPKLLILDEATSSIDSATEILLDRAVSATLDGRTGILIAHRLSTIRNADRILVFDQGRIVEEGGHDELLARPRSLYARMVTLQTAGLDGNGSAGTMAGEEGSRVV